MLKTIEMRNLIFMLLLSSVFYSCSKKKTVEADKKELNVTSKISLDTVKDISDRTKKLLVSNLTRKISESGTVGAMEFCNVEALPLTKSVAEKYGLEVKRVSDKNRNKENVANEAELKFIEQYKTQLVNKEELKGMVDGDFFYSPLVTNAMCLQCHGVPGKDIVPEVAATLAKLYPEDKATGYKENEIRGLLRIKMK